MEKSKIKYIIGISLLALFLVFLGYKKIWSTNASKVQDGVEQFLNTSNIKHGEIATEGFPFKIITHVTDLELSNNNRIIANNISIDEIKINSSLFSKKFTINFNRLVLKDQNKEIGYVKYNTEPSFLVELNDSMKVKTITYKDSGYSIVKTKTKQEINKSGATKLTISMNEENNTQFYGLEIDSKDIKALSITPEKHSKNIFAEIDVRVEKNPEINSLSTIAIDVKAFEAESDRYKLRLDGNYDVDFSNLALNTNLNMEVDKYQSILEDIDKKIEEQINFVKSRQDLADSEKEQYVNYITDAKNAFFAEMAKVNTKNTKNTEDKKYFEIKTTETGEYKVNGEDLMPLIESLNQFLSIFG